MIEYRRDIDGLRAIAVGTVVLGHAGITGFGGGYIGVDIFFVISGYLICSILHHDLLNDRYSLLKFYERRARRILPALFFLLAVCLVVGWFVFPPPQYLDLGQSALGAIFFFSNIWFLLTSGGYFSPAAEFEPLLHTWSLAVEEQFYLLFPPILWALFKWARRWIVPVIALGCAASFALSVYATGAYPSANFYLAPTRAWELGLGALLALGLLDRDVPRWVAELSATLGFAAIAAATFFYTSITPFPGLAALPPVLGSAAIIWAGSRHSTLVAKLLSAPVMVGLGLISYSLYLWHWPVLVVVRSYTGSVEIEPLAAAVAIAISVLLGWASWRFVERPFRVGQREPDFSRSAIFAGSAAGALALSLAGVSVTQAEGFWSRSNAQTELTYKTAIEVSEGQARCRKIAASQDEKCLLGKSADQPDLIVWGDSHAGALAPGLDEWLKSRGLTGQIITTPGCPPLLKLDRDEFWTGKQCSADNERALANILSSDQPTTVLLHARWPFLVTGERPEGEAGNRMILQASKDWDIGQRLPHRDLVEASLRETIRRLAEKGHIPVILSGVPEAAYDVPRAYLSQAYLKSGALRPLDRAEVRGRQGEATDLLQGISEDMGIQILDFMDAACSSECPVVDDGQLIYRDDDHLSEFGSRLLVPEALKGLKVDAN